MKIRLLVTLILLLLITPFSVKPSLAQPEDITRHGACTYCGMDRGKFAHSRMLIEYDDGSALGTCSIHCAAVDLAVNIDKSPKALRVGDYNTRELIDAEQAFWVIGGSKLGVMTRRAKWAFAQSADAEAFINRFGGELKAFEDAMRSTYEDMYQDTRMIREKRKLRMRMKHAPSKR